METLANGLPDLLTKDWPDYAKILWNKVWELDRKLNRLYTVGLVIGAVVVTVLLLTTDPTSIIGRFAKMFLPLPTEVP